MRRAHACLATLCLAAGLLAGCGSARSGLSAASAGALRSGLAAVESDAARGDRAGALAALSVVSTTVSRDASALSSPELTALRTGIARVRSRILATVPAPATTATAATATATPAPAAAPPPPATPGPPGRGPEGHVPPGHRHGHRHGHGDGGDR